MTRLSPVKRRYFIGIILLLGVVFLWVGSSFLISSIFTDQNFGQPFFLTYFNTGTFSIYLLIVYVQRKQNVYSLKKNDDISSPLASPSTSVSNYGVSAFELEPKKKGNFEERVKKDGKLSDLETAKLSLTFCLLWFCANWSSNASLSLTSVASSTILSSTSGVFTLILGCLCKVEKFNIQKLTGIIISLLGVSMVGLSDIGHSDPNLSISGMLWGDLLSLLGAVFYGLYITFLKYKVDDENKVDMKLFLGFVGLINLVIMIPIMVVLHYTNVEPFILPPNSTVWLMLLLNGLLGTFLSDLLWVYAVLMTSPLVVTLGLSLTIPIAMIGDILIKGINVSSMYAGGAIMVTLGFLFINTVAYQEQV